jgi:hypothetical protein
VAVAKNIPTLTPPLPAAGEATVSVAAIRANRAVQVATASGAGSLDAGERSGPGMNVKNQESPGYTQIRIRCPNYLSDQLVLEQQRARQEGQRVTLNYLILCALKKAGYRIDENDLVEDGRRLRS